MENKNEYLKLILDHVETIAIVGASSKPYCEDAKKIGNNMGLKVIMNQCPKKILEN